ncbi:MAG: DNA-methyltransferase, partial [Streptosporangiaceae bacterium]
RLACRYELLFLLTRSSQYWFDRAPIDADRRCDGDLWTFPTRPSGTGHHAVFPVDLPLRCILAGCRPGGLVLDPFSGTGTTGVAARLAGRRYLGVDINPAYHQVAAARFAQQVLPEAGDRS